MKNIVIFGAGEFGSMLFEYLNNDSNYKVLSFAAEKEYICDKYINGVPVYDPEELQKVYDKDEIEIIVAITFSNMNRDRARVFESLKKKGYRFGSYISSRSYVSDSAMIGKNVIILENSSVQFRCTVEDNVVIGPGCVIAHSSIVHKNSWLSGGIITGGFVEIGSNSFIGLNSTIADKTCLEDFTLTGAGAYIQEKTDRYSVYPGRKSRDLLKKVDGKADIQNELLIRT